MLRPSWVQSLLFSIPVNEGAGALAGRERATGRPSCQCDVVFVGERPPPPPNPNPFRKSLCLKKQNSKPVIIVTSIPLCGYLGHCYSGVFLQVVSPFHKRELIIRTKPNQKYCFSHPCILIRTPNLIKFVWVFKLKKIQKTKPHTTHLSASFSASLPLVRLYVWGAAPLRILGWGRGKGLCLPSVPRHPPSSLCLKAAP